LEQCPAVVPAISRDRSRNPIGSWEWWNAVVTRGHLEQSGAKVLSSLFLAWKKIRFPDLLKAPSRGSLDGWNAEVTAYLLDSLLRKASWRLCSSGLAKFQIGKFCKGLLIGEGSFNVPAGASFSQVLRPHSKGRAFLKRTGRFISSR
jgi:hypothetical protein